MASKWGAKWVHFKQIYGLGEGQLAFLRNLSNIQWALIVMNFISLSFTEYSELALALLPFILVGYIISAYALGSALDKRIGLVDEEHRWHNKRNPELQEILHKVEKMNPNDQEMLNHMRDMVRRLRLIEQKVGI